MSKRVPTRRAGRSAPADKTSKIDEAQRRLAQIADPMASKVNEAQQRLAQLIGPWALKVDEAQQRFAQLIDRFQELASTPEGQGWVRLSELLRQAAGDPLVAGSKPASEFLELMRDIVDDSITAHSAEAAMQPLLSAVQAQYAAKKNDEPRRWVLAEWEQHRGAYEDNKSQFAAHYARRLHNEREVKVSERTIRERWLKGR